MPVPTLALAVMVAHGVAVMHPPATATLGGTPDTVNRAAVLARLDSLQRQLDSLSHEILLLRLALDSGRVALTPAPPSAAMEMAIATVSLPHRTKTTGCRMRNARPESACTPGKLMTNDVDRICSESTRERRNVTAAMKRSAAEAYGVALPAPAGTIEIDHFIPLALGGDNAIENLWPEPAEPKPGFHEKDRVEVDLQRRVCDGEIDLDEAVRIITTDWVKYWRQLTRNQ